MTLYESLILEGEEKGFQKGEEKGFSKGGRKRFSKRRASKNYRACFINV